MEKTFICYDCHKEVREKEVMWVDVGKKPDGTRLIAPCHRDECIRWGGSDPPSEREHRGKKNKASRTR